MTYPLVKFVEAPDPAAAVRYDFNRTGEDGVADRLVMAEGFTLGSPTLEGDPDAIGVTYGFRQPVIPQRVKGSKTEALAALSSLSRELLRQTNWVLVQLDSWTAPIWLKTYRSEFGALSLDRVWVDTGTGDPVLMPDTWEIPVPLVADAFGYGERITLEPVTVTQTPDGDNPMRILLPTIKGDAPTGLRVIVTPAENTHVGSRPSTWMLGSASGDDMMIEAVADIGIGDGFTAGTGTAAGVADVDYYGGSYREVTIDVDDLTVGNNFALRLSGGMNPVPIGRYKVMLRCRANDGLVHPFLFGFGQKVSTNPDYQYGPTATAETIEGWVDLGDFSFPMSANIPDGVTVTAPPIEFAVRIGTADNAATSVRIDALRFIPVSGPHVTGEATCLKVTSAQATIAALEDGAIGVFDADTDTFWVTDAGDTWLDSRVDTEGGYPYADPAVPRNLLFVTAVDEGDYGGAGTSITALGAEAEVTVSYHPRYLHLGDGT